MTYSISANMRSFPLSSPLTPPHGEKADRLVRSVEQEFLEIASKSPLERLREEIMEDMKVDEGEIAKLEPQARQPIEDEIKRRMMEALQGADDSGRVIDKLA